MISQEILEKLVCFSDEEIDNLNNLEKVDYSIFTDEKKNVIDAGKILENGAQLTIRKHARFMEYPRHRHNYLELMYVYSGSMTHHIDNKTIVINQGELLLLNQNIEHSIDYCGENDIIFNFIIKPEFLDFLATMIEEDNEINQFLFNALFAAKNDGEYLVFKVADIEQIQNDVEAIIFALYQKLQTNAVTLKLRVGTLLGDLMDHPESIETYSLNTYDKMMLGSIYKYIESNYKNATLGELCQMISQPDYKVCKLVKQLTQKTFKEIVQEVRLTQAARLLLTTQLPVASIINEVGYDNMSYFYRIFTKKYGLKPKEFRESKTD